MAQTFYKVATPGLWIGGAVYLCTYFCPTVPTMFIPRFTLNHTTFLVFSCHCLSFSVFSASRSSTSSPLCRLLAVIHPRSFIPQLTSKNIHMLYYILQVRSNEYLWSVCTLFVCNLNIFSDILKFKIQYKR